MRPPETLPAFEMDMSECSKHSCLGADGHNLAAYTKICMKEPLDGDVLYVAVGTIEYKTNKQLLGRARNQI